MSKFFIVVREYQTFIFSSIIILFFLYFIWYTLNRKKKNIFIANINVIEAFPSILSTLGVLFTFVGIVWGLWNFDTKNISASVPSLLEGLKMAFLTSILGMITSMFMGKYINRIKDNLNAKLSTNTEFGVLKEINATLQTVISKHDEKQMLIEKQIKGLIDLSLTNISTQEKQLNSLELANKSLSKIDEVLREMHLINTNRMTQIQDSVVSQYQSLQQLHSTVNNIIDLLDTQSSIQNESLEETKSLSSVVRSEILAVTDAMDKGNKLMERKFDEFSTLMRKNNVEALVEVMKQVTQEFNSQMKALIDKLVKENFDELNKSVEKLNTWQQENKQMIGDLTTQYSQMTSDFVKTSTTLERVAENTHTLVKEDGKLQQIIDELRKVMIDDKKFTKITELLNESVEKVQNGTMSFEEATNSLNTWISTYRDVGDGVRLLVKRLDEINKIKDYNEDFWKGTKANLDEGLSIVVNASKNLNKSVTGLNEEFYERLNSTLVNLDSCIQAMYEKQNQ